MLALAQVAICRGLGGGGDCLDEKFSANHDDGLEGMHEVQYVSERYTNSRNPRHFGTLGDRKSCKAVR